MSTNTDNKDIQVEPVSIQKFMADLQAAMEKLKASREPLMAFKPLAAGNFADGLELAKTVKGATDARADKLYVIMGKLVDASDQLHQRLNTAVTNYNNADDLNKELAKDIDSWVQYLAGVLNLAPGAYTPGSTPPPK